MFQRMLGFWAVAVSFGMACGSGSGDDLCRSWCEAVEAAQNEVCEVGAATAAEYCQSCVEPAPGGCQAAKMQCEIEANPADWTCAVMSDGTGVPMSPDHCADDASFPECE